MARRPALRVLGALLAAAALLAASCGGGGGSTTVTADPAASAQELSPPRSDPVRVRLALAPDPVWEWLQDSGTVAAWEADHNIRIEASSPFDQFSAFAGGHADMVLINSLDVPQFVEQSNREPAIVGKYTTDRSILAVKRTSRAETLDDLVEARIAVSSSLGPTLLWGLIAEALHGLEFGVDGADFDLIVVDAAGVADLVMRGDADACICTPDFAVPYLADGKMRTLYDGRSAAEIYAQEVVGDPDALPMADVFLIDRPWHDRNEAAVAAILELWDAGLEAWQTERRDIIADYPHLFSVTTDAEIAWISDYATAHNWVVSSVHITASEAAAHEATFAEMQRIGLLDADARKPDLDIGRSHESGTHDEPDPNDDTRTHDEPEAAAGNRHSAAPARPEPPEPARG